MHDFAANTSHDDRWPTWWRLALLFAATLILCSCKAPHTPQETIQPGPPSVLPPQAYTGDCPSYECWSPPGLPCPWPHDEYLCDGGDAGLPAHVRPDWHVDGLELEDTIAHYDTLDGRTIIEPTNRVCVYAPRFAAVRSITSLNQGEQVVTPVGVEQPIVLDRRDEVQIATTSVQREQSVRQVGRKRLSTYRTRYGDGLLSNQLKAIGFHDHYQLFEDLSIIRIGRYDLTEGPRLQEAVDAAIVWTHDTALQVAIEGRRAEQVNGDRAVQMTYTVNELPGEPKLRVVKVASTQCAAPGETVDFTIRFDNVGQKRIGNVTVVDNLTTRLEYVPDSAQASVDANFSVEPNEGESLRLRWEIIEPLDPGDGGIVRFQCRVR